MRTVSGVHISADVEKHHSTCDWVLCNLKRRYGCKEFISAASFAVAACLTNSAKDRARIPPLADHPIVDFVMFRPRGESYQSRPHHYRTQQVGPPSWPAKWPAGDANLSIFSSMKKRTGQIHHPDIAFANNRWHIPFL